MGRASFTHPRFRVIRLLGEGGMGRVYLARDLLGKGAEGGPLEVALKVYPSRSSDARLKKEFLALRELHHPGIARAYHFGAAAGGEPFFTMERVRGEAIDVHLARAGKPASSARGSRVDPIAAAARLAVALRLFTEAAAAAAYMHRRRVLHLDIKPANILVVDPGGGLPPRPVLIDFGLARAAGDAGSIGHGTLPFAPPEILAGHAPTAASDVYALGATFHRSLSGRNPYPGTSAAHLARAQATSAPAPIPGCPASLSRVIVRALSRDPAHRFRNAGELHRALLRAAASMPGAVVDGGPVLFHEPDFTGRAAEVAAAVRWLDAERRGEPLLVIDGEAGMGKTRFLEKLETLIETRGAPVLAPKVSPDGGASFLADCARAITVLSPPKAPGRGAAERALADIEKQGSRKGARGGSPEEPRALAARLLGALVPLLEGGAFLLVDDFHLASRDEKSLVIEAARALARSGRSPAGGIVIASLPGGAEPEGSSAMALRIALGPFGLEEALDIDLEGLDGALARFSPERALKLKTELHRQTGGHPLFYVRGLLDLAGDAEAAVRLAPTERIAARIERLDAPERDAAGALAALGRPMAVPDLGSALALGPRASGIVERLRAAGIAAVVPGGAKIIHESVARAILEALGPGGRKAVHARLAAHLSKRGDGGSLAEAAGHAFAAGDRDLGVKLASRGAAAPTLFSPVPDRVVAALREAARISGPPASDVFLERASDALAGLGRYEECLSLLDDLTRKRELEPSREDPSSLPRLHRKLGGVSHRAGRIDLALEHLERALRSLGAEDAPLECLRARAELALLHHFRGETERALEHSRKGLELWKSRPDIPRKDAIQSAIDLHGILGQVRIRKLELDNAIQVLREGLRLARELGTRANIALLWNNLALAEHLAGRFGLALATFRRAEKLASELGDSAALASIRLNIAQILSKQGQFAKASELLDEIEEMPAVAQSRRLGLYALYTRGLILGLLRAGADEVWARVESAAGEVGDSFLVRIARIYRAEERLIRGALSEARDLLAPAAGEEAAEPVSTGMRASRRALLEAVLGREDEAEAARAEAAASRSATPSVIAAWNDVYTGASLIECGRADAAREVLDRARKTFRATGFAAGEIECWLFLADLDLRRGPRGEADLRRASRALEAARAVSATAPSSLSPRSRDARAGLLEARLRLARRRLAGGANGGGDLDALVSRASADIPSDADARVAVELVASIAARLGGDPVRAAEALRRLDDVRAEIARGLAPADAPLYLARDPWKRFGLDDWRPLEGGRTLDARRGRALAAVLAHLAGWVEPAVRAGGPPEVLRSILAAVADEAGAARAEIAVRGRVVASWGSRGAAADREPSTVIEAPIARGGACEGTLRLESLPGKPLRAEDEAFLEAVAHALAPYLAAPILETRATLRTGIEDGTAALTKPLEPTRPLPTAGGGLRAKGKPPSTEALARLLEPEGVVAGGREIRRVLRALRSLAASDIPVLITGESGTGKNIAARILHLLGPRGDGPFVAQNTAAVPEDLFEADLFGYEQGAFTGAEHARTGFLFQAGGGTFHIEEVGDLGLELQRRLLRVIEEKAVRPLGSTRTRSLDVRFVASTQRDIEAMVRRGEFRKDLFFRLDGARVHLPPLRQRLDELPDLVRHYWRELAGPEERFPRGCLEALCAHDWPGNIRELISVLRRIRLETSGSPRVQDVRAAIGARNGGRLFSPALFQARRYEDVLRSLEESYLEHLVEVYGGNLAKIASELGTTTRSIYRRFEKLGLKPRDLKR